MVKSRLRQLRAEKEKRDGRKLTYDVFYNEAGISTATVARLLSFDPVKSISGETISSLCRFFEVGIGDILEYVPDKENNAGGDSSTEEEEAE